ncbi:MDR family MFS transporter [Cellulomonas edaphi]|uniref:MDR family MFS transporter n=1 Tax=Cellulomonas edaphi TaxID=3053468 RepID=A0ABT7S4F3_9CELL|nr:MDR family MFS transporter [Cellulomons edaphi]MDM7830504.1 MDR family MFS transporter [Cellulomons edaphi]
MVTTGLVAIDSTILATAVPTIVRDLGGFASFPWLFSLYLLTQAVTVPIYSKLADTWGRKPVVLVGIALFGLGSVLCGLAWSMPALIAFRAVQGLGAGAVQPMAVTIAGDIYTVAERAKVQGYIASVWGVSSVVGPTLGGLFSQVLSWRWIFFVNIPLCVVAAWLLWRRLQEDVERRKHRIDWAGGALLTASLSLLVLGILEGGNGWAWDSTASVLVLGTGLVLMAAFLVVEKRAQEPVLPLRLLSRRLLATAALISVGVGVVLIGLTSYIPSYLEALLGVTPLVSGLTLALLTIGWPISASQSGRLYLRFGFRFTALVGTAICALGCAGLLLAASSPSVWAVGGACLVVGLGLGLTASPTLIAAQSSVDWGERAVVTGANLFARSIGSAVGVAVMGAIVNASLRGLDGDTHPAQLQGAVRSALVAVLVVALLMIVAAAALPRDRAASPEAQRSGG